MLLFLGMWIFFSGVMSLMNNRSHIITMLISFEVMMLGLFMLLFNYLEVGGVEMIFSYLILVVCEAGLGLGLLVLVIFYYGSEVIKFSNFLLW